MKKLTAQEAYEITLSNRSPQQALEETLKKIQKTAIKGENQLRVDFTKFGFKGAEIQFIRDELEELGYEVELQSETSYGKLIVAWYPEEETYPTEQ